MPVVYGGHLGGSWCLFFFHFPVILSSVVRACTLFIAFYPLLSFLCISFVGFESVIRCDEKLDFYTVALGPCDCVNLEA